MINTPQNNRQQQRTGHDFRVRQREAAQQLDVVCDGRQRDPEMRAHVLL